MEMDRNRRIYVYGSGEHINVNMDFKRFLLPVTRLPFFAPMKLKFVMTRLSLTPLQLNVGIRMIKK